MVQSEWSEREKIYACWLCSCPHIGNRQIHLLSEICGGPEAAYFADPATWMKALSLKQAERLKAHTAEWRPKAEYHRMLSAGIKLVTIGDAAYPKRLREIPDAPYGIFLRGRLPDEEAPAVAVIGARECSEYGRYVASQLGAALGRSGIALISGMARGVDGISQEAALEAGGYSAGVLGCGVDVCYPAQNGRLYDKLAQKGAVLSAYPMGTPAYARNFPPRNRIVSGLADAVVVIEARAKSGTLITVDMALEQGREVYVVPGRVTDRLSDGCNRLIKQGAAMLLCLEEFLEEIRELLERKRSPKREPEAGHGECGGCRRTEMERRSSDSMNCHTIRREHDRKEGWEDENWTELGDKPEDRNKSEAEDMPEDGNRTELGDRPEAGDKPEPENKRESRNRPEDGDKPELRNKPEAGDKLRAKNRLRDGSAPEFGRRLPEGLSEDLAAIYRQLDFVPKSPDEIRRQLPASYRDLQITSRLMQLTMEGLAVQVSPGHFCLKA